MNRAAGATALRSGVRVVGPGEGGSSQQQLLRKVAGAIALILLVVVTVAVIVPPPFNLIVGLAVGIVWIWRRPFNGLLLLIAASIVVEIFPLHFPDSLTDRIPFFQNLNNAYGLNGISATPAEILMGVALLAYFVRRTVTRTAERPGALAVAYVVFTACVIMGELHGLLFAGGDLNLSLWEVRPQVYGFLMFLLATSVVKERKDLIALVTVFFAAILLKAGIGDWRYLVTLSRDLGTHESVLGHEDSFFLSLYLIAALVALVWGIGRKPVTLLLLGSPVVLVALLANQRRAGEIGLAAGLLAVTVLAIRFRPSLRNHVMVGSVVVAICLTIFLSIFWNHQTGVLGQIVRPVRSLVDPTGRDFRSDAYRLAETANLELTFKSSPVIGVGFGIPYKIVYPMADISQIYPLWNYIPHNSLFWIAMRMGVIGYVAFWCLIGIAVLQAIAILGTKRDPLYLAFAAFTVAAIGAELMLGYTDLQIESYRNMILIGALLGVLNRIPSMPDVPPAAQLGSAK
jgi:hypothetical protein